MSGSRLLPPATPEIGGQSLPEWGTEHVHDPTIVQDEDGVYWCLSTDACATGPVRAGVQLRRSQDLVTWTFHGWALDDVPADAAQIGRAACRERASGAVVA